MKCHMDPKTAQKGNIDTLFDIKSNNSRDIFGESWAALGRKAAKAKQADTIMANATEMPYGFQNGPEGQYRHPF